MKIYIINKDKKTLHAFDDSSTASTFLWGKVMREHIIIISQYHKQFLVDPDLTNGSTASLKLTIDKYLSLLDVIRL